MMSANEALRHEADQLTEMTTLLARALQVQDARLEPTLDAIVATAAALSNFDAGVALMRGTELEPQAATGRGPHLLDIEQQRTGTGPCVDAARSQHPVHVVDTRSEARWGDFGMHAAGLGVLSMLCFPLWVAERSLGSLSLYADRPDAFDAQDERIAMICATLAAVALADAQRTEHLLTALHSRDTIGQAKGILIERHRMTPDQAFAALADVSQRRNRKLTVVAQHLVETGAMLGEPDDARATRRA
jgi:GAF domain-containing protein